MPKEIAHWHLAEQAYRNLPQGSLLRALIRRHRACYLLGATAMDCPFYLSGDSAVAKQVDTAFHNPGGSSYDAIGRLFRDGSPEPPVLAFVLGAITHIHIDAGFHPLIDYFSGTDLGVNANSAYRARIRHRTLETLLDVHYLRQGAWPGTVAELLQQIQDQASLLEEGLARTLSRDAMPLDTGLVHKMLQEQARIQGFFSKGWARRLFRLYNLLPWVRRKDDLALFYPSPNTVPAPLFAKPIAYRHPVSGDERHEMLTTVEKRTLAAIGHAFASLEAGLQAGEPQRFFAENDGPNLHTGLAGVKREAMRHFDIERPIASVACCG